MTERKWKKHSVAKWAAITLVTLVVVIASVTVYLNIKFRSVVEKHLNQLVAEATDSLYKVEFSEIRTNVLTHRAVLKDIRVIRDTLRSAQPAKQRPEPSITYEISIGSIIMEDFHPFTLLKYKDLHVDRLSLQNAVVHMFNRHQDFNIRVSDAHMQGINLPLYLRKRELFIGDVSLSNGSVEVFNNRAAAAPDTTSARYFPHQLLRRLNKKITVKRLNLEHIDVSYAEYSRKTLQTGKITFTQTSGTIRNITNSSMAEQFMRADLSTYLMGQGKLDVHFRFDLRANNGAFRYKGLLAPMDGRALNQITKPLAMLEIKKCNIGKLEFDIQANNKEARGTMKLLFKDLSVKLLKREQERLVRNGLMSFLANAVVIRPDNPDASGRLVTANIRYERVTASPFFKFTWKALLSGIKSSIGISPAKEREIKAAVARFNQKKAERERRRLHKRD
ncbi:hypothetical protein [Pedobacter deserti]|uniref:hypothetical protein n=1 Tax=Pedobacter deserti TaxID=2817382 RepID=UPI00210A5EED|nr:hypothetical protein [Pedobacter sp. SYSU D00382]